MSVDYLAYTSWCRWTSCWRGSSSCPWNVLFWYHLQAVLNQAVVWVSRVCPSCQSLARLNCLQNVMFHPQVHAQCCLYFFCISVDWSFVILKAVLIRICCQSLNQIFWHKLLDYIVHIVPRISPLLVAFWKEIDKIETNVHLYIQIAHMPHYDVFTLWTEAAYSHISPVTLYLMAHL